MPIRVVNVSEKDVVATPPAPVAVPALAPTDVLPAITGKDNAAIEVAGRYIQNLTGADLYYCFGDDCDNVQNYHGLLQDKLQLDCSNHGQRVSVFSTPGGIVSVTILRRIDMYAHEQIFLAKNP